jgi:hypothetical protein
MSDQVKSNEPSNIECSICGRDGGPAPECGLCSGNQSYAQPRHFTLTEERQGLSKDEDNNRYGNYGEVGPVVVNLPGSYNPFSPKTNK